MSNKERVKTKKASFVVVFKELLGVNEPTEELSEAEKKEIESLNLENDNIKVLEAELINSNFSNTGKKSSKNSGGFASDLKIDSKDKNSKKLNNKKERKKEEKEELIK